MPKLVDNNNYLKIVNSDTPNLIIFRSHEAERAFAKLNDRKYFKIDSNFYVCYYEEKLKIFSDFGIRSFPSYYIFKNGVILDSIQGPKDTLSLIEWYDQVIIDKVIKSKYIDSVTPMVASDMIEYLEESRRNDKTERERKLNKIKELSALLDISKEEDIQQFLLSNPFFFDFIYEGGFIINKFPFGNKHISDFITFGLRTWTNDIGLHSTFIELESPQQKIFNKNGDPAAGLTHAIRQVQDWNIWLTKNYTYLQNSIQDYMITREHHIKSTRNVSGLYKEVLLKAITHRVSYKFMIIIGRRDLLTIENRIQLEQMNDSLNSISILTYDALIEGWMRNL